jgi:hypothetical protein
MTTNTHTLSSVALLPDFQAIENLKYNSQADPDCGDSDEDNSFFEQKSQRNSTPRSNRHSSREEKEVFDDCGSDDDTLFK